MRSDRRYRLRTALGSLLILGGVALAAAPEARSDPSYTGPLVSCPGGYLAPSYRDCPPVQKHMPPPAGHGGGGGRGGLLGGLLGGLGL
jgi:hypothetical protein